MFSYIRYFYYFSLFVLAFCHIGLQLLSGLKLKGRPFYLYKGKLTF
jgi:hypothetical protein